MIAQWDDDAQKWVAINDAFKRDWEPTHWIPMPIPPCGAP
jgi:hypothetical protein